MPDVGVNTENVIIASVAEQEQYQSLASLYDKYSSILYGVIFRIVNNEAVAEEVLTKVFLKIRNGAEGLSVPTTSFFEGLFKSSRELSFQALKQQQLQNSTYQNGVYGAGTTAFDLLYYKGLNYNEAAVVLNRTVVAVKAEVRATVNNLKNKVTL